MIPKLFSRVKRRYVLLREVGCFMSVPYFTTWLVLLLIFVCTKLFLVRSVVSNYKILCPMSIVHVTESSLVTESSGRLLTWPTSLRPDSPVFGQKQSIVLAGHSRLRQLYERLVDRLQLRRHTRSDPPPPHFPDHDHLGNKSSSHSRNSNSLKPNSTCLAAFRHPRPGHELWCSQAADNEKVLVQHRWHREIGPLWQFLEKLTNAASNAQPLPHVLVVTHGVYLLILLDGALEPWPEIETLRSKLSQAARHLDTLRKYGVRVLWMLEHHVNSNKDFEYSTLDYRLAIVNTMIMEVMYRWRIPVWSSHHPVTVDWVNRVCREDNETLSADTLDFCLTDFFHLDTATLNVLVDQFWKFVTGKCY